MTEQPKYTVIKKQNDFELRRYAGYIKAEVEVGGEDYKSAAERGFNILAGYIFGNNVARQKIAMTAPVAASRSEKIAMTVPVTISRADTYHVAFIMPSAYTLETLPAPKDERVRFIPCPPARWRRCAFRDISIRRKSNETRNGWGCGWRSLGWRPRGFHRGRLQPALGARVPGEERGYDRRQNAGLGRLACI